MESAKQNSAARDTLALAAVGAAGIAATSFISGCTHLGTKNEPEQTGGAVVFQFERDIPGEGNSKVLNYALLLEELESEFYRQVLLRLTTGGKDNRGYAIDGLGLGDDQPDVRFVKEFGRIELEHRDLLATALTAFQGLKAIKESKYDFKLANAPRQHVMDMVYTIERTGARAYLGAIKYFPDFKYVRIAAAIQGTEARHYAAIAEVNRVLFGEKQETAPMADQNHGAETPMAPNDVLMKVSPYIVAR